MPEDGCRDCKKRFPGGEGLVDGRCPTCLAVFLERHKEPEAEPTAVDEEAEED